MMATESEVNIDWMEMLTSPVKMLAWEDMRTYLGLHSLDVSMEQARTTKKTTSPFLLMASKMIGASSLMFGVLASAPERLEKLSHLCTVHMWITR